jgi:hypothetical protein
MVFASNGNAGSKLLLPVAREGSGYVGTFDVGLQTG